ncbi:protein of unknown function [Caballeronia sp. S22]
MGREKTGMKKVRGRGPILADAARRNIHDAGLSLQRTASFMHNSRSRALMNSRPNGVGILMFRTNFPMPNGQLDGRADRCFHSPDVFHWIGGSHVLKR